MARLNLLIYALLLSDGCATSSQNRSLDRMNDRIVIFAEHLPPSDPRTLGAVGLEPTEAQVAEIEKKLSAYLKAYYPDLSAKHSTYYRQYGGYRTATAKGWVYGNFMCRAESGWRTQWIDVEDGGDCYFSFRYDLEQKKISEFVVNGRA